MKQDGIFFRITEIFDNLSSHAKSLLYNATSNLAESLNSVIAKNTGGKRINYSLRNSYSMRCNAAVSSFNSIRKYEALYRTSFKCSPNKFCKKLDCKAEKRRCSRKIRQGEIRAKKRKLDLNKDKDTSYDPFASKPDIIQEEFEAKKSRIIDSLQLSDREREDLQKNTIKQADSPLWIAARKKILTASHFGEVCRRKNTLVKKILYADFYSEPVIMGGGNGERGKERRRKKIKFKDTKLRIIYR
nr:uncharacterized protein LOC122271732 [Parasteatoda tepidariorum]